MPKKNKLLKPSANEGRRKSAAPSDHDDQDDYEADDLESPIIEVKRTPDDQVQGLTQADLDESFTKTINAGDPNVATSLTHFDHEKGEYVHEALNSFDHLKIHFFMEGELIHVDTDEARAQIERNAPPEQPTNPRPGAPPADPALAEDVEEPAGEEDKLIKNQFNFSERATQTFNNPKRTKEVCTEPPPTMDYNEQVSQWVIFDTYLEEIEKKIVAAGEEEKKKSKKKGPSGDGDDDGLITAADGNGAAKNIFEDEEFGRAMKMMERMIHTSSEAKLFQDYKFFEDNEYSKRTDSKHGSFTPLWRLGYEDSKNSKMVKNVTTICWNPQFTDLFAVGYGSYDFIKQGAGMICCYTLKNTSHPEYMFHTESGVMTVDFHPDHPSLLCVGMYDGTVSVYDLRRDDHKPIFMSSSPVTKHTDPVWQVCWGKELPGGVINFYSISSDGHVVNWALSKTELAREEITTLTLQNETNVEGMDSSILGLAGGSCFDFNKNNEHLFVVGTEEGAIQSYSKEFNAEFLRSFDGHHMAVYSVKWNTFHPEVFLSCSADWTVKLWEANTSTPIMTFDLGESVGDVAWAPFSSTVFATITWDRDPKVSTGKVCVYDLSVNKHEPIGEYPMPKKAKNKLTNICFNPIEPIICVGDDRGIVSVLKLSPNLRKMSASTLEEINAEAEIKRLTDLMIMPTEDEEANVASLLEAAKKGNVSEKKEAG